MPLAISIASITFSDGTVVPLAPGGVLIIVGPNNSGKSHALRDLRQRVATGPNQEIQPTLVITDVALNASGTGEDLKEWLAQNAHELPQTTGMPEPNFGLPGLGATRTTRLVECWERQPRLGELSAAFFVLSDGQQRLSLVQSVGVQDTATSVPDQPLQVLYLDAAREERLVDATREAFGGMPVVVNRVAGSMIHLHVGELPDGLGEPLPTNATYRDAINALPMLSAQGDGIRAFVGLVLTVVSAKYAAVLVDEPEAFLHPPQERALGGRLAVEGEQANSQLVLATHSVDVLLGVLGTSDVDVTVVRLRRDGAVNRAAVLDPESVRALWNDPILRFSNALDGVFHRGVVVVEGDSDARVYDATLHEARKRAGKSEHGLLFTHCGGKQRAHVVVEALRGLDVPVRVVCDIDALRDEQPLRRIVEALGGEWDAVKSDWQALSTAITLRSISRRRVADVRREIDEFFDGVEDEYLSKQLERQIEKLAHADDAWSVVKEAGQAGIPSGEATAVWQRLDAALRGLGLFVVPVGTLERWDTSVGNRGPKWAVQALAAGLHTREGAHADFVSAIDESIA
jgi:putative AbiEii toxin of type IV toxin-antitoxin system/OLD-like protein